MSEKPHNPNPLVPPTPQMRAYWEALGRFIHGFAHVERLLFVLLRHLARVSIPIGQAVFSGVRVEEAKSLINRVLEVEPMYAGMKDDLAGIFGQLAYITKARNDIVHYGTVFNEGDQFLVTNSFIALTDSRKREMRVSAEMLDQMSEDLDKIGAHIVGHLSRHNVPDDVFELMVGKQLRAPWRYKPPQQARSGKRPRTTPPKRSRPPRSSPA